MSDILIGCPVKERDWILPLWTEYVKAASATYNVEFLFVAEEEDQPTFDMLNALGKVIQTKETRPYTRNWANKNRLKTMVEVRNLLLSEVRNIGPDYFLSLDSDILLHPDTIDNLIETISVADNIGVVGGLTYLDQRDHRITNIANINPRTRALQRVKSPGIHEVDVVMAIKMMSPESYKVDYQYDLRGEDIGWCNAVRESGVKIFCDGRVASKHVMMPKYIDKIDERVGF